MTHEDEGLHGSFFIQVCGLTGGCGWRKMGGERIKDIIYASVTAIHSSFASNTER